MKGDSIPWRAQGTFAACKKKRREAIPESTCFILSRWRPQEVSAFGEEGEGDHLDEWTVQCGGSVWKREESVRFRHKSTDGLLSVTGEQYGRPIHGQMEVHAMSNPSQHSLWKVMEGVFMKPSESPAGGRDFAHTHTEFWLSSIHPQLHLYQQPPSLSQNV